MKDQSKTKQALIQELDSLRQGIEELKKSKSEWENERDGLKKSEARFRSYFDLPLYGIAITSPEKGWIEVNDRICSILGYSRDEIVRMTWTEMTHPDDLAADLEQFNRVLSGQTDHYHMEKRFIRKDGKIICTDLSVGCVRKPDGSVDHIVAVVEDITSVKLAEKELQASEEKYRSLFNNSIDAVLLTIPDGIILAANPEACRIFQRSEEEICRIGRAGLMDLTDPRLTAALEERARTGRFQGELTFIRKDGTSFPGEVSTVIFRDHDGRQKTSMIVRDMSEKRKREQDYQSLFREMLNGFAVHEIICDARGNPVDYRFLTVNPAFERITGLKAEHIVGRTVLEVLPDIERYWIETYGRVALTGEPALFENYSKALDKYFVVTAFHSGPNQFACNFIDITERKRAEVELRANKAQLSNALEMAHLGHWEYDVATDLFTFNDQFYKIFRTTAQQIGGYTMHAAEYADRFVHPEDMHKVEEETRQAIETTDPHFNRQLEHRILYADGTVGYITVRFFIVKDSHGRTVKTYGVNQDITERKRSEEALRESEKKFRTLTQNTPDIISRLDREGRHVFINKAIEKVTNLTVEDYLGKTNEELGMPRESLEHWNHQFRKAFETAKPVNFEFDFPSPDGIRSFFSTVVPEFDEEGRVSTLLVLARDITDRKESMEKLRKALEATVRAVAVTVETRDPYTAGHQRGVADLSLAIAMELKLTSDRIDGIQMAAMVHDLGKISVPADILSKPTKLTKIEFELIKTHPQSGYDILKDIDFPWPIARMILEHHERMDGSGYPRKLRGDDILLESRILAVADVVESMASHRPYRPALGLNAALEEIEKNRGTIYDADAVDACLRLIREKRFQFGRT